MLRNNSKTMAIFAIIIVLLIAISGCSGTQGNESTTENTTSQAEGNDTSETTMSAEEQIVVSTFNTLDNDYFIAWNKGAEQAAEDLGLRYVAITTEGDGNKEVSAIESSLTSGAKIFASVPIGMQSVPTITELATNNDAFMSITWDIPDWFTPQDAGDGFASYLRPDMETMAYNSAKTLFEHLGGTGVVIHITGLPGTSGDTLSTKGVEAAAAEYPGIEVVGQLPGNYNRVDSQKVMENMLTTYPEFDAIIGQNDATAIGAVAALEAANKTFVPITGSDGSAEALELIKEGKMFSTVSTFPEWQGGYAVVRAYDAANGYKPKASERMMNTGYFVVTPENVDSYMESMYGNEKLPYDWKLMSRVLNQDNWDPQNALTAINPLSIWDEANKPSGYELPQDYLTAIEQGEIEDTNNEYADHYKIQIVK